MTNQRVALITGSSRGIGRGIAKRLAADGIAVAINYVNSEAPALQFVQQLESAGQSAVAIQGSVAESDDRRRLIETTLSHFGRLDFLINNAGITSPGRNDILEATEAGWDTVLSTNLKGPFFLSQLASRSMIDQIATGAIPNGQIINISSISAYAVSTNRADYCIAKAGMQMMTWQFAARLADEGINVYEICPGVIASDMTAPVQAKYDKLIDEGLTPIRRWGQPEDIASAVSALVAGAFPFSTGERINVDGGFHLRQL